MRGNVATAACARTSYVIFSKFKFQSITKTLPFISVKVSRNGVIIKDFIGLVRVLFDHPIVTMVPSRSRGCHSMLSLGLYIELLII